jgi:hypothetical protein
VNGWRGETDKEEKIQKRVEHDLYYIEVGAVRSVDRAAHAGCAAQDGERVLITVGDIGLAPAPAWPVRSDAVPLRERILSFVLFVTVLPLEFGRVKGLQQHLQAFLVYGWTGAMAYFVLLASNVYVGVRAAFLRTPVQPYVITSIAALVGVMMEGFVIDTDHWRHFFLVLSIIWGAAAASAKFVRRQPHAPAAAYR